MKKCSSLGVKGYLDTIEGKEGDLNHAVRITCEGLADYAKRLAQEAERLAVEEKDAGRSAELNEIARICHKVPYSPSGHLS